MKYSEIRDWVVNHIEHCSKEEIVELYEVLSKIRKLSELMECSLSVNVEWDE